MALPALSQADQDRDQELIDMALNPMNPQHDSRAKMKAVRKFSSAANAVFMVVLAVIVVLAATFFFGNDDQSAPTTTTIVQSDQ